MCDLVTQLLSVIRLMHLAYSVDVIHLDYCKGKLFDNSSQQNFGKAESTWFTMKAADLG